MIRSRTLALPLLPLLFRGMPDGLAAQDAPVVTTDAVTADAVLRALERGEIDVDEASRRLEAV